MTASAPAPGTAGSGAAAGGSIAGEPVVAAAGSAALRPLAAEPVTYEGLLWITACLALALMAGVSALPVWVTVTAAGAAAIRLLLAARGRGAPPRALRLLVSACAIGVLFLQLRTFNGLSAGTSLLSLIAGLKLLETRTRRDIYVITMIIYFLSLATLLQGESFWLLGYVIGVSWLTTATLLRLTNASAAGGRRASVRPAGRLLLQALPLALAFWLFFPRFGGPLWQIPDDGGGTPSGLSDTMSPGDITDLAMSDEVAFRVRFRGDTPPAEQRYWRGPVLHEFDGHQWRRSQGSPLVGAAPAPALLYRGPAYDYTVSLEPNDRHWLFVLDWPAHWDAARAVLTGDYMLVEPNTVSQPTDLAATSYADARAARGIDAGMRSLDTRLPPGRNPRSLRLAQTLRSMHPDDLDYIRAVLGMFHTQAFFYTLTPPRLGGDSVDEFLFDSRRGFCGHYASAFAALMRAVGIPARVVTGYQGGTFNRFANYWIVRQSDAHAWDEVWLDDRGWMRVDPTSAIAPERVDRGLNDLVTAGGPLTSRWQQRTPWFADARLRLDALRLLWRERILRFDESSQEKLLGFLHVPVPDGQKLALVLALCLIAGMSWLTWAVRRELEVRPADPARRAYEKFCRRLASAGLPQRSGEGAEDFAARVAGLRPDLAADVTALCREYSRLRYGTESFAGPAPARSTRAGMSARKFAAAVRAFRPRRARPR